MHWCAPSITFQRESQGLLKAFGQGQHRLGICHVLAVVVGGSNGLPLNLGQIVAAFDLLCRFLACRGRRSCEGHEGVVVVARQAMVKALVIGSLSVVCLQWTAVIIAEIAIVNHSVVCINRALQGWLLLVCRILRAVGPRVLCRFVREEVDRARYLTIALGLFIA
jgi:hypothetical protein